MAATMASTLMIRVRARRRPESAPERTAGRATGRWTPRCCLLVRWDEVLKTRRPTAAHDAPPAVSPPDEQPHVLRDRFVPGPGPGLSLEFAPQLIEFLPVPQHRVLDPQKELFLIGWCSRDPDDAVAVEPDSRSVRRFARVGQLPSHEILGDRLRRRPVVVPLGRSDSYARLARRAAHQFPHDFDLDHPQLPFRGWRPCRRWALSRRMRAKYSARAGPGVCDRQARSVEVISHLRGGFPPTGSRVRDTWGGPAGGRLRKFMKRRCSLLVSRRRTLRKAT
jgi:hypothetical protein